MDREKPVDPEILVEWLNNLTRRKGDAISSLEWRNFKTGNLMQ